MRRELGILALLCCGACRHEVASTPAFVLQKVCSAQIAKLEAALPRTAPLTEPSAELRERVRELVLACAREQGKLRAAYLSDAASVGAAAVPLLDAMVDEKDLAQNVRLAALEVLGAIDTPNSADALVKHVNLEQYREPWVRAQAAFQLAKLSSDRVLLRLIAQLKYETDGETVIWMACALAKHKNYAGLEGLRVLAAGASTQEVRADAAAMMVTTAEDAGFTDGEALYAAWFGADVEHRLPHEDPSLDLRLEVWRCIASLAEFDLRIVDDARFALSRSAGWVVDPLCDALHEDDVRVRLHSAQSLERMGPRARRACKELALMLEEPRTAPQAAAALGAVGCAGALDELVQHAGPQNDLELRNAVAAALGRLGSPGAVACLRTLLAPNEPLDLRQAAAQSLLALEDDTQSASILVDCLTAPGADAGAAENALEIWLTKLAALDDASAIASLARWKAIAGDSSETPPPAEATRRRRERAVLLRDFRP